MSYRTADECFHCDQPIHRLLDSDLYPWVHTESGHPRCKPFDRAYPKERSDSTQTQDHPVLHE